MEMLYCDELSFGTGTRIEMNTFFSISVNKTDFREKNGILAVEYCLNLLFPCSIFDKMDGLLATLRCELIFL